MRRLLQEISEDLCRAIGESPELSTRLTELEAEGYSLNLILDCRESSQDEKSQEAASGPRADVSEHSVESTSTPPPAEFRIDASDLAFLRSVGIDPTRPGRSRRRRKETSPSTSGS